MMFLFGGALAPRSSHAVRQLGLALLVGVLAWTLGACRTSSSKEQAAPSGEEEGVAQESAQLAQGSPPLGPPPSQITPRAGMIYVPPGALVVGTPREKLPRLADRELPGEQVMLEGFYIDQFPFPNEEGAIPVTNVSWDEAAALCAERDKRLCTELEWERACKGPDNSTYEYGDTYHASICEMGRPAQLRPAGYHVGCQSDFGVRDLHGGPFEWTASLFGRGQTERSVAVRGGNGTDGALVGRCAHVEPLEPSRKSGTLGFRCCAGPANEVEVDLRATVLPGLTPRAQFEESVEESLLLAFPEQLRADLEKGGKIRRERVWQWSPLANEQLHLIALCGRGRPAPSGPRCGLWVARISPGQIEDLAWVSSGQLVADLHRPAGFQELWVLGGDVRGSFRHVLQYRAGALEVGEQLRGGVKKK